MARLYGLQHPTVHIQHLNLTFPELYIVHCKLYIDHPCGGVGVKGDVHYAVLVDSVSVAGIDGEGQRHDAVRLQCPHYQHRPNGQNDIWLTEFVDAKYIDWVGTF